MLVSVGQFEVKQKNKTKIISLLVPTVQPTLFSLYPPKTYWRKLLAGSCKHRAKQKIRKSSSVASAKSVWEGQVGPATALKLSRVLTLAYRPFRQGLLNKLKGSRSLNNDCEYSGRITLPEPHSVSEVKRDALAGWPSAQMWKICHENKVSGWKKKISQASVQSYQQRHNPFVATY